jgi:hypothetical protein
MTIHYFNMKPGGELEIANYKWRIAEGRGEPGGMGARGQKVRMQGNMETRR